MEGTKTASSAVEVRINRGIYALNRFLMTLQNKRVPLKSLDISADAEGTRAVVRFDCPPERATRYVSLVAALEDVRKVQTIQDAANSENGGD
jgi:hypothetical protein